jgi:hypothetical protein
MLNNVVVYWAYIRGTYIWGAYIRVGLYSGGLIFGGGRLIVGGLRYNKTEIFKMAASRFVEVYW